MWEPGQNLYQWRTVLDSVRESRYSSPCAVTDMRPRIGAINFLFALPAIKSIDILGRRKWLNATLPFMALFMLGGAVSSFIEDKDKRIGVTACFMFRRSMGIFDCLSNADVAQCLRSHTLPAWALFPSRSRPRVSR